MALNHSAALRTSQASAVLSAIGTSGYLVFVTSDLSTVVSKHALSATAGTVTAEDLAFDTISDSTGAATIGGVISSYIITTSADAPVVWGDIGDVTVTGGGGVFTVASLTVGAGDTVSVGAGSTYTAAP